MAGYLDDDEATRERIREGWLHTGDLGRLDPEGHLHLHGRLREMVVTPGGKNLYPEDLELLFHGIQGCEEFAILPTLRVWPATGRPETLMLLARPTKGGDVDALQEALLARNRTLAAGRRIHGILVVPSPEFPRTSSLKLKRSMLAERLAQRFVESDVAWLGGQGAAGTGALP